MVRLFWVLLPLTTIVAKAQQPWTFTHGKPGMDVRATDLAWADSGLVITCDFAEAPFHPPQSGSIIRLSTSGLMIDDHALAPALHLTGPKVLLVGPNKRLLVIVNYAYHADSTYGFFHFGCAPDGTVQDSAFIPAPGAIGSHVENAIFLDDETIIVGGSLKYQMTTSSQYTQLLKLSEGGEVLETRTFGIPGLHLQYTRDILPYRGGLLVSTEQYPQFPGIYYQFTTDLEPLSDWFGQAPHPDPLNPLDSIVKAAMTLRSLPHDSYMVGGAFKIPNDQYSSAVYVVDSTHATKKIFVPHSPYSHDHSALFETISSIDTGSFYFLSWENIYLYGAWIPYEATEPDVLHVYKLDNDLNVLCEYVLDGFADSTHYFPTRIKTTPDGGFAILGGKKDMTDPNANMQAWVQTFGASDCVVGIEDREISRTAIVYPNPGSNGFEVVLSGHVLSSGRLTLHDARGAQVAEAAINGSMGSVDCTNLPSGLYLYRITDRSGQPVATGRWVKQ